MKGARVYPSDMLPRLCHTGLASAAAPREPAGSEKPSEPPDPPSALQLAARDRSKHNRARSPDTVLLDRDCGGVGAGVGATSSYEGAPAAFSSWSSVRDSSPTAKALASRSSDSSSWCGRVRTMRRSGNGLSTRRCRLLGTTVAALYHTGDSRSWRSVSLGEHRGCSPSSGREDRLRMMLPSLGASGERALRDAAERATAVVARLAAFSAADGRAMRQTLRARQFRILSVYVLRISPSGDTRGKRFRTRNPHNFFLIRTFSTAASTGGGGQPDATLLSTG